MLSAFQLLIIELGFVRSRHLAKLPTDRSQNAVQDVQRQSRSCTYSYHAASVSLAVLLVDSGTIRLCVHALHSSICHWSEGVHVVSHMGCSPPIHPRRLSCRRRMDNIKECSSNRYLTGYLTSKSLSTASSASLQQLPLAYPRRSLLRHQSSKSRYLRDQSTKHFKTMCMDIIRAYFHFVLCAASTN